jgi:hypothetical protein
MIASRSMFCEVRDSHHPTNQHPTPYSRATTSSMASYGVLVAEHSSKGCSLSSLSHLTVSLILNFICDFCSANSLNLTVVEWKISVSVACARLDCDT